MTTEPSIDQMRVELLRAGWLFIRKGATVWKSPSGELFLGPYGAWKALNRMKVGIAAGLKAEKGLVN